MFLETLNQHGINHYAHYLSLPRDPIPWLFSLGLVLVIAKPFDMVSLT
jgi:hypothetical protein